VRITAALAANLKALNHGLDDPGDAMTATLQQLALDARLGVHSYLGLSVIVNTGADRAVLTALDEPAARTTIAGSLRMPLPPGPGDPAGPSGITLIFYAARAGAFVDLAADLAWLTGRDLAQFVLDADLMLASQPDVHDGQFISSINQAIGVLIARGQNPDQAKRELAKRAARDGVDAVAAANTILNELDREIET
jgi:hypothetical protein